MSKSRLTMIACCFVLVLVFSSTAIADFKRDYTVGKKSFEDAEYANAIQKFRAAIADKPGSAALIKLYGVRFDSYIPYYYLGQSYFQLNDCSSAIEFWNQAIRAGVIQEMDEIEQMQVDMKTCNSQAIDISGIVAQATEEIDHLDAAIISYVRLEKEGVLAR